MYEDKSLMIQEGLFLGLAIHLGISSLVKYICSQVLSIQLRMGCLLILSANTLLPFKCKKKRDRCCTVHKARMRWRICRKLQYEQMQAEWHQTSSKSYGLQRSPKECAWRHAAARIHFWTVRNFLFQINIMSFFGSVRNMYNLLLFTSKYPDKTKLI